MSLRLTPEGTFIRSVQFVLPAAGDTPGGIMYNFTNSIRAELLKGIESIRQFFTQSRVNKFEVAVHNSFPQLVTIMMSEEPLDNEFDNTKQIILLPDMWHSLYSEPEFTDITSDIRGYFYARKLSEPYDIGFRIEIEFKNMLGIIEKPLNGIKDKKFAAMFQKNNILQALIEKDRIDKNEDEEEEVLLQKLRKHDKIRTKKKVKDKSEDLKYY